jgi:hypothetical protein
MKVDSAAQASRVRISQFKCDVVDAWGKHDLSTAEYAAALSDLVHDINARLLADERKKVAKKARKKEKTSV